MVQLATITTPGGAVGDTFADRPGFEIESVRDASKAQYFLRRSEATVQATQDEARDLRPVLYVEPTDSGEAANRGLAWHDPATGWPAGELNDLAEFGAESTIGAFTFPAGVQARALRTTAGSISGDWAVVIPSRSEQTEHAFKSAGQLAELGKINQYPDGHTFNLATEAPPVAVGRAFSVQVGATITTFTPDSLGTAWVASGVAQGSDAASEWQPAFDYTGDDRKQFSVLIPAVGGPFVTADGVNLTGGRLVNLVYPDPGLTSGSAFDVAEALKANYVGEVSSESLFGFFFQDSAATQAGLLNASVTLTPDYAQSAVPLSGSSLTASGAGPWTATIAAAANVGAERRHRINFTNSSGGDLTVAFDSSWLDDRERNAQAPIVIPAGQWGQVELIARADGTRLVRDLTGHTQTVTTQGITKVGEYANPESLNTSFKTISTGIDFSACEYIEIELSDTIGEHVNTQRCNVGSLKLGADKGALFHWYDTGYVRGRVVDAAALALGNIDLAVIGGSALIVQRIVGWAVGPHATVIPTATVLFQGRTLTASTPLGTIYGQPSFEAAEGVTVPVRLDLTPGRRLAGVPTISNGTVESADLENGIVYITPGNAAGIITATEALNPIGWIEMTSGVVVQGGGSFAMPTGGVEAARYRIDNGMLYLQVSIDWRNSTGGNNGSGQFSIDVSQFGGATLLATPFDSLFEDNSPYSSQVYPSHVYYHDPSVTGRPGYVMPAEQSNSITFAFSEGSGSGTYSDWASNFGAISARAHYVAACILPLA